MAVVLLSFVMGCGSDDPVLPLPLEPDPGDTTGHEYIWYVDTLGGWLSRVNDVFCFSENDAWAVGHFYVRDSTGKTIRDSMANAAHWDGRKWTLVRINPYFEGASAFSELFSIFCLAQDDIWVNARHWDGNSWKGYYLTPIGRAGGTYKIWGDRAENVYFVGENGSIIHWDGVTHTQIGPETTAWFRDTWGWDGTLYIAATDPDGQSGRRGYLVRMESGSNMVLEKNVYHEQSTVWGMQGTWYSGGCGPLFRNTKGQWLPILYPSHCITGIRGTALNDVYIYVQQGEVIHYNGSTFSTVLGEDPHGIFTSKIAASGYMVLAIGHLNEYAVVKRGYRQSVR